MQPPAVGRSDAAIFSSEHAGWFRRLRRKCDMVVLQRSRPPWKQANSMGVHPREQASKLCRSGVVLSDGSDMKRHYRAALGLTLDGVLDVLAGFGDGEGVGDGNVVNVVGHDGLAMALRRERVVGSDRGENPTSLREVARNGSA